MLSIYFRLYAVGILLSLHHISIIAAHCGLMTSLTIHTSSVYSVTFSFVKASSFALLSLLKIYQYPFQEKKSVPMFIIGTLFCRFSVWLCIWLDNTEVPTISNSHCSTPCGSEPLQRSLLELPTKHAHLWTICRDNFDALPLLQGHGAGPSGLAPALQNDRQSDNLVHSFICLVCISAFDWVMLIVYLSGPEEARTSGWSSMDRRRAPLPIEACKNLYVNLSNIWSWARSMFIMYETCSSVHK